MQGGGEGLFYFSHLGKSYSENDPFLHGKRYVFFLGQNWKTGCEKCRVSRVSIQGLLMSAFCVKDVLMEVE